MLSFREWRLAKRLHAHRFLSAASKSLAGSNNTVISVSCPKDTEGQTAALSAVVKEKVLSVALVGRPNVGKSSLFNRLTGSKSAIVSNVPGTTRDRKQEPGNLAGLPLIVMDTGGLDDRGAVSSQIQVQVQQALQVADVLLFMLDAKTGVTTMDEHFASWLRKKMGDQMKLTYDSDNQENAGSSSERVGGAETSAAKEIVLVANKTEGAHLSPRVLDTISEALRMGLGDPIPISATHGDGIADLAQVLLRIARERGCLTGDEADTDGKIRSTAPIALEDRVIQLAIMGRPNVGKSSLLNAFVREDRVLVGPTAGLTRDAIKVEWTYRDRLFRLVDTAGLTRIRANKLLLSADNPAEKRQKQHEDTAGRVMDTASDRRSRTAQSRVELPGIQQMSPDDDPSQFSYQVSEMALVSALNALRFAQVVLLVVESTQGKFSKLDLQLARKCLEEGRALVIAANKSDLALSKGMTPRAYEESVRKHSEEFLKDFGDVPVVACSAVPAGLMSGIMTGTGAETGIVTAMGKSSSRDVDRILNTVVKVHDAWSKRVDTWVLNRWLKDTMVSMPAPRAGGKNITVKYMVQVKARPPTFALFTNATELPKPYERFIRSKLQHDFSLEGVPLRFFIRKSKGTAADVSLLKGKNKISAPGLGSRRGAGHGSARTVGPKRKDPVHARLHREQRDERRRKESRMKRKLRD